MSLQICHCKAGLAVIPPPVVGVADMQFDLTEAGALFVQAFHQGLQDIAKTWQPRIEVRLDQFHVSGMAQQRPYTIHHRPAPSSDSPLGISAKVGMIEVFLLFVRQDGV